MRQRSNVNKHKGLWTASRCQPSRTFIEHHYGRQLLWFANSWHRRRRRRLAGWKWKQCAARSGGLKIWFLTPIFCHVFLKARRRWTLTCSTVGLMTGSMSVILFPIWIRGTRTGHFCTWLNSFVPARQSLVRRTPPTHHIDCVTAFFCNVQYLWSPPAESTDQQSSTNHIKLKVRFLVANQIDDPRWSTNKIHRSLHDSIVDKFFEFLCTCKLRTST